MCYHVARQQFLEPVLSLKTCLYGSRQAIEEQWYLKLKNRSIEIVYDPRNVEKIYIPHDNGMDYEACILLEPSQQYRNDFLEEIVFLSTAT